MVLSFCQLKKWHSTLFLAHSFRLLVSINHCREGMAIIYWILGSFKHLPGINSFYPHHNPTRKGMSLPLGQEEREGVFQKGEITWLRAHNQWVPTSRFKAHSSGSSIYWKLPPKGKAEAQKSHAVDSRPHSMLMVVSSWKLNFIPPGLGTLPYWYFFFTGDLDEL